jgi:hypothetical protein
VFSHSSLSEKVKGRFESWGPAKHYEKLEHVGDSILGMVVTTWLHETRPSLTCGTATVSVDCCTAFIGLDGARMDADGCCRSSRPN